MTEETKNKKYVTLSDGTDFRKIASLMSEAGYQMNHATARNVLISAMKKVIRGMSGDIGNDLNEEAITRLLQSPDIHKAFGDVLHEAYEFVDIQGDINSVEWRNS